MDLGLFSIDFIFLAIIDQTALTLLSHSLSLSHSLALVIDFNFITIAKLILVIDRRETRARALIDHTNQTEIRIAAF